jgi:hypothetical protein
MKTFAFAAIIASAAYASTQTCVEKWVEGCLSSPDEASCVSCTKALTPTDCSLPLEIILDKEVCTKAPFNSTGEQCIIAASDACSAATDTKADCHSCVLKNSIKLKNAGCSLVEVA